MVKKSAGLLFFRFPAHQLQVLLVHPGGPFWSKKDNGAWSIPKGEAGEGEDLFTTALREVKEETGIDAKGNFAALAAIKQKGGKQVYAWAIEAAIDSATIVSNTFEMEWPSKSGMKKSFPEIDKAAWFSMNEAREKIIEAQLPLLDQLEKLVTMKP